MGNANEAKRTDGELMKYLKPGIELSDLINLRKAFVLLDKNNTGTIKYDINKIYEIEKYNNLVRDEESVILNFDQFMEIMSNNIIINRKMFGTDKIQFESETSNVTCILCPFKRKENEQELFIVSGKS